eukprot:10652899-Heterocapsa_arctica.AAC.1
MESAKKGTLQKSVRSKPQKRLAKLCREEPETRKYKKEGERVPERSPLPAARQRSATPPGSPRESGGKPAQEKRRRR